MSSEFEFIVNCYEQALERETALIAKVFDLEAELFKAQLDIASLESRLSIEQAYSADPDSADRGACNLLADIVEIE